MFNMRQVAGIHNIAELKDLALLRAARPDFYGHLATHSHSSATLTGASCKGRHYPYPGELLSR